MLDVSGFFLQLTDSVSQHNNRAVFGAFYGYSMSNESLFLAMKYFPLRDLKRHIEAGIVDEEGAKKIVYDLLVGLKIMHAEGIVHRDLKPEVRCYIFIPLPFRRFVVTRLVILSHH
jgi:serine/threonine protein kinase